MRTVLKNIKKTKHQQQKRNENKIKKEHKARAKGASWSCH